jgi:hypothetical protein
MRCGVETMDKQVFCDACLASMEQYPIKPGTAVHLPQRDQKTESKKNARRKKGPSPEEQLLHARRVIRFLSICLLSALVALAITGTALYLQWTQNNPAPPEGRNYSTTQTT